MQKLYYSISEVSALIDEEQHILRYWQKEFTQLKPRKNRSGNRVYSSKDITLLKLIKKLLRDEKKSLKEAKDYVENIYLKNQNLDDSLFFDYEISLHTHAIDEQIKSSKNEIEVKNEKISEKKSESVKNKFDKKEINDILGFLREIKKQIEGL
jgi:DNA-binding transcriptional MerR regulator